MVIPPSAPGTTRRRHQRLDHRPGGVSYLPIPHDPSNDRMIGKTLPTGGLRHNQALSPSTTLVINTANGSDSVAAGSEDGVQHTGPRTFPNVGQEQSRATSFSLLKKSVAKAPQARPLEPVPPEHQCNSWSAASPQTTDHGPRTMEIGTTPAPRLRPSSIPGGTRCAGVRSPLEPSAADGNGPGEIRLSPSPQPRGEADAQFVVQLIKGVAEESLLSGHLATDSRCRTLAFVLTPGQAGDAPAITQVMSQLRVPRSIGRPGPRRTWSWPTRPIRPGRSVPISAGAGSERRSRSPPTRSPSARSEAGPKAARLPSTARLISSGTRSSGASTSSSSGRGLATRYDKTATIYLATPRRRHLHLVGEVIGTKRPNGRSVRRAGTPADGAGPRAHGSGARPCWPSPRAAGRDATRTR